ncbi:MAG TPA: phage portal protein [Bryobacteraceae bacterium]|nr:phage portal protein [Bryobacteraceae bacterium]
MNIRGFFSRLLRRTDEVRPSWPLWDAAGGGSRLANWAAPSTAFASTIPAPMVRERARDAYRNNPWARRAVDALAVGAVGAGIKPQARADGELKRRLQQEWLLWTDAADFAGRYDFYGLQQAALRTMLIDGEAIIRLLIEPGQRIPLQLQLLTGEYLDSARVDGQTLNGIEYDGAGRRVAYWLFRKHPADAPDMQSIRVPAEQVIHLYAPIQPGVERGVSWLAPALVPLRELQEFVEAALVRQKIASLFCGYVQTADGSNPLNQTNAVPTLEPGSMVRLQPGEAVEFSEPPDVGQTYEPFVRQQLRAIASALNVPYEILSGDVSQVTFASGRHALLEYRRQLESIQHHLVVFQLCRPVWEAWTRLAVAAGVLPEGDYRDVRWIAPQLSMLDQRMEVQSVIQQIRAGLISRSEAVSASGWDAEQIDAEIAADNARADALGNVYDSDPRRTTLQGQEQPTAQEAQQ